jgi:8-oxo-dGTP pyrophosphatase MutT (NUDIX family)
MSEQEQEKPYLWKVFKRKTIHESPWLSLHQDWVELPDGSVIEGHHVVDYPRPAVAVVGVNEAGQIMMIDHYRFITGKRAWEIPGGGIDPDETPEVAARREMLEESGCTGGEYTYIGQVHPSNGSTNQLFMYYFATGIQQTHPIHDTNEIIGTHWFTVAEVREMILRDEIPDGFSLIGLLLAFFKGYLK